MTVKNIEFKSVSVEEFNKLKGTEIKKDTYLFPLCDELENNEIEIFYASGNHEDVINAIENEIEIAERLNLELIEINGYYLAIY